VSKTDPRQDRIAKRIAASQERLQRDGGKYPAKPHRDPLPDAWPPEDYRSLAKEYPWLAMAAGLGVGVLVAALLPRNVLGKAGRRAMGAATVAAELGVAFSKQAREAAREAAQDGLTIIDETTAPLRQRTVNASKSARSRGMRLAGEAMKIAGRLRK
jgi:hypothetical protein